MNIIDILPPGEATRILEQLKKLPAHGLVSVETVFIKCDGSRVYVERSGRFISYAGSPAVLSIARDITERKRLEENLKRSVEELEAVVEIQKNIIERHDLSFLLRFIVSKAREINPGGRGLLRVC